MDDKKPNTNELIAKFLAGEANDAEKQQLRQWIDTSPENKTEFERLKKLWENVKTEDSAKTYDVDKAWNKLQQRIYNAPVRSLVPKTEHNFGFYFSRIAATIILLISVYLLFKLSTDAIPTKTIVAEESVVFDTLPDQSMIALKQNSELAFPEIFEENQRRVSLSGEAFFKVYHNPQKPFTVQLKNAEVRVLGTSFLVQAYDSLKNIKVAVEEGRVRVSSRKDSLVLVAGQSVLLSKESGFFAEVMDFQVNDIYWASETLVFKQQKLVKVFKKLEGYFNIKIEVQNQNILNCKLSAKFESKSADQILEVIAASFGLKLQKLDNKFIINGKGCN